MTNGEPILVRGVMKPIPTLYKPLMSVDIETHEPYKATVERSDPTALPAAGVVMEAVVATVLATEVLEKFSSDNLEELKEAVAKHRDFTKNFKRKSFPLEKKVVYIAGLGLIGASLR